MVISPIITTDFIFCGDFMTIEVDRTDLRILRELQKDGRLPIVELANRIALSATACQRRVKKLEDSGVIAGSAALLDPVAPGQQRSEEHTSELQSLMRISYA